MEARMHPIWLLAWPLAGFAWAALRILAACLPTPRHPLDDVDDFGDTP